MIAVTLLALLLVAAVPVALLAAVVMMLLGHVVGGLALFGRSVLAAAIAVALAGVSGMRRLRQLRRPGTASASCGWTAARYADVARSRGQRLHQPCTAGPQRVHRSSLTWPPLLRLLSADIQRRIRLVVATVN